MTERKAKVVCHECGVIGEATEDELEAGKITNGHVLTVHHPGFSFDWPEEVQ